MDRLTTYIEALRVLASTHDPNRVMLIERNIDNYLKTESGVDERGLERLCVAIHNEEAEQREGEDWNVAGITFGYCWAGSSATLERIL